MKSSISYSSLSAVVFMLAESAIAGYLAHLRAALQWADDSDMLPAVPKFKRIRRAKVARTGTPMKGRPITTGKVKYASLHDLRRSFGERWSVRVTPQVLMALMRHEAIETTMGFYVGLNAQTTADAVWAAYSQNGVKMVLRWVLLGRIPTFPRRLRMT